MSAQLSLFLLNLEVGRDTKGHGHKKEKRRKQKDETGKKRKAEGQNRKSNPSDTRTTAFARKSGLTVAVATPTSALFFRDGKTAFYSHGDVKELRLQNGVRKKSGEGEQGLETFFHRLKIRVSSSGFQELGFPFFEVIRNWCVYDKRKQPSINADRRHRLLSIVTKDFQLMSSVIVGLSGIDRPHTSLICSVAGKEMVDAIIKNETAGYVKIDTKAPLVKSMPSFQLSFYTFLGIKLEWDKRLAEKREAELGCKT
ncbi:hypothetical protein L484_006434 [Morus notabilis]|uniref:Uncharacterized protein n=1 Tax=Morus notabilis TaxID=981085 RepID=W9RMU1_9ROSA|nr:hypothetical protein L484_006434 [Morus notabilis]